MFVARSLETGFQVTGEGVKGEPMQEFFQVGDVVQLFGGDVFAVATIDELEETPLPPSTNP